MSDETTDHAAALLNATEGYILDSNSGFSRAGGLTGIRRLAGSVVADLARVVAYAERLESMLTTADERTLAALTSGNGAEMIHRERREAGVTDLMDTDR